MIIIKLSNGEEIVLNDIAEDPKIAAIQWLQEYKTRRQAIPSSRKEIENDEDCNVFTGDG